MTNILMYHGTTSVNLANILKCGLIKQSQTKSYSTHEYASLSQPSLMSLDGVYFATDTFMPLWSANRTIGIFGGYPLIIEADVDLSDALPDEDKIRPTIECEFNNIMASRLSLDRNSLYDNTDKFALYFGEIDSEPKKRLHDTAILFHKLNEDEVYKEVVFEQAFKEYVFDSVCQRMISHLHEMYQHKYIIKYMSGHKKFSKPPKTKSIVDAENHYLEMIDVFCKKCKNVVYKEYTHKKVRVDKNVGFSGNNKITRIYTLKNDVKTIYY